jgi:FkbM family methyltransferase
LSHVSDFEIFLDCGVGFAATEAWSISDRKPDCEIIGFEPHDGSHFLLEDIFPGELYKACISNKVGHLDGFMGHEDGKSDFWLRASAEHIEIDAYRLCNVESTTVDEILKNKDKKAFIWADIEGSEPDMLFGAINSIKQGKIVGFFLETSPKTFSIINKILLPFGFKTSQYRECGTHADWLFYK